MIDWLNAEIEARRALEAPSRQEQERMLFLAQLKEERPSLSPRRRLAALIVRSGLKLDREAIGKAELIAVLEGGNLRD
jgi:hypothetical protein